MANSPNNGVASPHVHTPRGDEGAHRDLIERTLLQLESHLHALMYMDARRILITAIGDIFAANTEPEQKTITRGIELLIGTGASNPVKPGLIEGIVRDRVRIDRMRKRGLEAIETTPSHLLPRLGAILQLVSGLHFGEAIALLVQGLGKLVATQVPPTHWDQEMEALLGSNSAAGDGQVERALRQETRRP